MDNLIEWRKSDEGFWSGYLGLTLWCDWVPPDRDDEAITGYVFGVSVDGWMCDATTLSEAKDGAEKWTVDWLKQANLMSTTRKPGSMFELKRAIMRHKIDIKMLEKEVNKRADTLEEHF